MRMHWKRKNRICEPLSVGKVASFVTEEFARGLKVKWHWIVNTGCNVCLIKRFTKLFPAPGPNYVEVVAATVTVGLMRQLQAGLCQQFTVKTGDFTAAPIPPGRRPVAPLQRQAPHRVGIASRGQEGGDTV